MTLVHRTCIFANFNRKPDISDDVKQQVYQALNEISSIYQGVSKLLQLYLTLQRFQTTFTTLVNLLLTFKFRLLGH